MHVKAKKMAFGGVLLALTVICMVLGSVIETGTLFLLAAASYFVGIVFREFGGKLGGAFYSAGVILGVFVAPNKMYVVSYAAMGLYILSSEILWELVGGWKKYSIKDGLDAPAGEEETKEQFRKRQTAVYRQRRILYVGLKYIVFNLLYLPAVFLFQELLFGRSLPGILLAAVAAAGQIGVFLYDCAYVYVQREIWGKLRGRFLENA